MFKITLWKQLFIPLLRTSEEQTMEGIRSACKLLLYLSFIFIKELNNFKK